MRSPIFQSLPTIMGETIIERELFEVRRQGSACVPASRRKPKARRYFFREYRPINSPCAIA